MCSQGLKGPLRAPVEDDVRELLLVAIVVVHDPLVALISPLEVDPLNLDPLPEFRSEPRRERGRNTVDPDVVPLHQRLRRATHHVEHDVPEVSWLDAWPSNGFLLDSYPPLDTRRTIQVEKEPNTKKTLHVKPIVTTIERRRPFVRDHLDQLQCLTYWFIPHEVDPGGLLVPSPLDCVGRADQTFRPGVEVDQRKEAL